VARCSLGKDSDYYNEDLLYKLLGINAELLIDHAWGYEPVTIADIKQCQPKEHSLSMGQVLTAPYPYDKGRLIVREMTDLLVLDLVSKHLITDQMVLNIGYDIENLSDPVRRAAYHGPVVTDHYGRRVPKGVHGSINLPEETSSTEIIMKAVTELYESIADPNLLIRRVNVVANHVKLESAKKQEVVYEQLDLFTDYALLEQQRKEEKKKRERERALQEAVLDLKSRYGKNTILKGMNLEEGATTRIRNGQIGGHSAGEDETKDEQ
jgi:DNA polymerase V